MFLGETAFQNSPETALQSCFQPAAEPENANLGPRTVSKVPFPWDPPRDGDHP